MGIQQLTGENLQAVSDPFFSSMQVWNILSGKVLFSFEKP